MSTNGDTDSEFIKFAYDSKVKLVSGGSANSKIKPSSTNKPMVNEGDTDY